MFNLIQPYMWEIKTWNRLRYSLYAPFYDLIGSVFNKARRRSIQLLNLQSEEELLLLGTGTGFDVQFLPEDVHITAIDITPAMVKQIETRARRLNRQVEARIWMDMPSIFQMKLLM